MPNFELQLRPLSRALTSAHPVSAPNRPNLLTTNHLQQSIDPGGSGKGERSPTRTFDFDPGGSEIRPIMSCGGGRGGGRWIRGRGGWLRPFANGDRRTGGRAGARCGSLRVRLRFEARGHAAASCGDAGRARWPGVVLLRSRPGDGDRICFL
jgi:hypothetical protein